MAALLCAGVALATAVPATAQTGDTGAPAPTALSPGRYLCSQEIMVEIGFENGEWTVEKQKTDGEFMLEVEDVVVEGKGVQQRLRVLDRKNSVIEPEEWFYYFDKASPEQGFKLAPEIEHNRRLFASPNGQIWVYDSPVNEGVMMLFSGLLLTGQGSGTVAGLCTYIDLPS